MEEKEDGWKSSVGTSCDCRLSNRYQGAKATVIAEYDVRPLHPCNTFKVFHPTGNDVIRSTLDFRVQDANYYF